MKNRKSGNSNIEVTGCLFGAWAAGGRMWYDKRRTKSIKAQGYILVERGLRILSLLKSSQLCFAYSSGTKVQSACSIPGKQNGNVVL